MKVLLLEDDRILGESLQEYLELEDFEVDWVHDGEAVFEQTFAHRYDLYVLDINVPEINGLEVLRQLREAEDMTPAIYVSALNDIESITAGFEVGAVDYLKKPFDPEELIVRIRHHLQQSREGEITYGSWTLDADTGIVTTPEETFHLGEVQKNLLLLLLRHQGEVVRPEMMFEHMREPSYNSLRVAISKLKKRLDIPVQNIRGEGYMLERV